MNNNEERYWLITYSPDGSTIFSGEYTNKLKAYITGILDYIKYGYKFSVEDMKK